MKKDDLTAIPGIGPATQAWLRGSLRVDSYRDLANLSVEEIEARLSKDRRPHPGHEVVARWIEEAERLADAAERVSRAGARARTVLEPGGVRAPGSSEWKEFAQFVVTYERRIQDGVEQNRTTAEHRTTAHYLEGGAGGGVTNEWPGIESEQVCEWMLERLQETMAEERMAEARSPASRAAPASLRVTELVLSEPDGRTVHLALETNGVLKPGALTIHQPFSVDVVYVLEGERAARERPSCRARLYAHNLSTAVETHVGDSLPGHLADVDAPQHASLPDLRMPGPGIYRLDVVVLAPGTAVRSAFARVPVLHVS